MMAASCVERLVGWRTSGFSIEQHQFPQEFVLALVVCLESAEIGTGDHSAAVTRAHATVRLAHVNRADAYRDTKRRCLLHNELAYLLDQLFLDLQPPTEVI